MTELNRVAMHTMRVLLVAALLGATAACDDEIPPVFEVDGTGAVEGLVFLDVDRDGRYDPSAGDEVLPDLNIQLYERGTASAIANASAQTDANGRFEIPAIPVGSHDLFVDTVGIGAGVAFCQNPMTVDVFLNETQFRQVTARGGCVITIAEAEQLAPGTSVTIRGSVTSHVGQMLSDIAYIQDVSGGMQLFRVSGGADFAIGDVIEVTGEFAEFNQEFEVTNVRVNEVVAGSPVEPKVITTARITEAGLDSKDADQGRLVKVEKAEFLTAFGAGGGRNASIDDGSGVAVVRIESGTASDPATLNQRYTPGKCYDIVGILRNFRSTGQLTPRSFDDVVEVPCS